MERGAKLDKLFLICDNLVTCGSSIISSQEWQPSKPLPIFKFPWKNPRFLTFALSEKNPTKNDTVLTYL